MREKRGVLLTVLAGAMLLTSCGKNDNVPAGVAEVTAIEIKQEGPSGNGGGNSATSDLSEAGGENSNSEEVPGAGGENGNSGEMPGAGGENRNQDVRPDGSGKDGIIETLPDGSTENDASESDPGDSGQTLPAGAQGAVGIPGGDSGSTGEPSDSDLKPLEVKITISAAGDVTMGNYLGQGYEVSFRQTYAQGVGDSYFFENVVDIFSEDSLTLVNLEGPLTRSEDYREGQTYCISGDPEYTAILTAGSVEAVSMANNHRLDYKEQGTADTVAALEEAGILYAYDNNYCMYETNGIQIGIVSVNEVGQGTGVEKYLQEGVEKLRQDGADLVFACCHWGIEREYYPEDYQKSLGKKCIDWGYDLVIGHHPHVLQGIEEYQGKFILYSLGNFCFGANRNPPDKDCMIFQQTFTFLDGELQEDQGIRVIPCSVSSISSRNDYKPTPAAGEEAQRILDKINECSRDFGVEFDADGYLKNAE